jgi:hypothetical protein
MFGSVNVNMTSAEFEKLAIEAAIGRLVQQKLISGNEIPVERCTVYAREVEMIITQIKEEKDV